MTANETPAQWKAKLSLLLMDSDANSELFKTVILYITYKTIESNKQISINRMKALLSSEFLWTDRLIDGAIASLVSSSCFQAVHKWRPPKSEVGSTRLSITYPPPAEFKLWLEKVISAHPELQAFTPPVFVDKPTSKEFVPE